VPEIDGTQQSHTRARNPKPKKNTKQAAFLAAYAETGNITQSAKIAKVNRTSHNLWLKKDDTYQERFDVAHLKACDRLEQEARRRAVEGVKEPVFQKGVCVGYIQRFSDKLLEFLMRGALPKKYKTVIQQERKEDHQHTHTHKLDIGSLNDDEQRKVKELFRKARLGD